MEKKYEKVMEAYNNSYSPYSNFKVGACLCMKDGTYVIGCNVENASYGLTNCAERSALFSAYSNGYKKEDIKEIVIISKNKFSPCGACRQVITELMEEDAIVTVTNLNFDSYSMKVKDLLPNSFGGKDLHD